jgi:ubiquinone/menaquinone biosynthesis C-methylase UbiE
MTVLVELGSGFHPHPDYNIHIDINPKCPQLDYVASVDNLPMFADNTVDGARACDVLEHFSYRDTIRVLTEWRRVLKPGATIYIQCPDAKLLARMWLDGTLSLMGDMPIDFSASYWIMGGHNDGVFAKDDETWRYNAHYTLFSPESLRLYLERVGFSSITIQSDGGSNLMCWAVK